MSLLNARRQQEIFIDQREGLKREIVAGRGSASTHVDLKKCEEALAQVVPRVAELEAALGRLGDDQLHLVRNTKYFEARMEASVLKTRLRSRLIQRKMELSRIERPLRTQANGEYISRLESRIG